MKKKAFTLIELLVVIAIIAILAAILFPVFTQAKNAAKKTQDISNMKQIALASQMYLGDSDDTYHRLQNGARMTGPKLRNGPEVMLQPYLKSEQIWEAPNDSYSRPSCLVPKAGGKISYSFTLAGNSNNNPMTDTFGIHGMANDTDANVGDSFTATALGEPAQTIHIYPLWMTSSYQNNRSWYRYYSANLRSWPVYPDYITFAYCAANDGYGAIGGYAGMTNWGFADGHVKSIKQTQIMDPLWVTNPALAVTNKAKNLVHYDAAFKS
ncbi:MAG: prepilin-type N-terminal cleavage/methylation domain-containing protein [Armatimonadetes bacterium]|nr:prepilin-type N-terminal cleavage/methylation domain-containing protein [Armatimonadota bacterium]